MSFLKDLCKKDSVWPGTFLENTDHVWSRVLYIVEDIFESLDFSSILFKEEAVEDFVYGICEFNLLPFLISRKGIEILKIKRRDDEVESRN